MRILGSSGATRMRAQSGTTLIEMMIACLIMAFVSTAFLGILLTTYKTSAKVTNSTDTASAVRIVKEKLGADIRQGRTLGDVYGTGFTESGIWIPQGVDTFPGPLNPVYGDGQAPSSGWPTSWTGGGVGNPYQLSNTCLIVQVPVLDNHNDNGSTHNTNANPGWPTAIFPASYGNGYPGPGSPPVTGNPWDNVETHVYMVKQDPNNAGEYQLEWCSFPGYPVTGYLPAAHSMQPQVLLKGIVGPLKNGTPQVFQFIDKTDPTGTPRDTITPGPAYVANYTGVVVNLEIRSHAESNVHRKDLSVQPIAFKTEIFLRNNAIATTNGSTAAAVGP
jgi:hypothetical protein